MNKEENKREREVSVYYCSRLINDQCPIERNREKRKKMDEKKKEKNHP